MSDTDTYIVWVGGSPDVEGVTKQYAEEVADEWRSKGYDDVVIESTTSNRLRVWNEAYELRANLTDLNDEELLSVRSSMKERCERIMEITNE